MSKSISLSPDELLTTTRSVRKRLDLTRPVERDVILDCVRIAQQAPTASNMQNWHFVVVTEAAKRAALAELYRKAWDIYLTLPVAAPNLLFSDPEHQAMQGRVGTSAQYLTDHLHEVPVFVIPCFAGRVENEPVAMQAAMWGTIGPAAWSFMLAARARGLGTAWTTLHLVFEQEAASILGIPYAGITQACLFPVAYFKGTDFKPAWREPLDTILHWDSW
jgi:nitroreductase